MRAIQLMTDSCCDLPSSILDENHITELPLTYAIEGVDYAGDSRNIEGIKGFYDRMRGGAVPKTSQIAVAKFQSCFREAAKKGGDILYLGFSSALSGTVSSAQLAAQSLKGELGDTHITVVDTLSASLGQGLLVYQAAKKRAEGRSLQEVAEWVEANRLRQNHWFTVGDLEYLYRGGRISSIAHTVGTVLQMKPILRVDDAGRLVPWSKVRGRRKSILELGEKLVERIVAPEAQVIAISHGDCEEEAHYLASYIRERVAVKDIIINYVGPIIGAHSGPGTLALFFLGDDRN